MYLVENLYEEYGESLSLRLVAGEAGIKRRIAIGEAQRPGLSLGGYYKHHAAKRLLIFGRVELEYLRDLKTVVRKRRLKALLGDNTPAVIVARNYRPPEELVALCEERGVPLLRSKMQTMKLFSRLTVLLADVFSPQVSVYGTLVEVFGVGVLIRGDSSVGKSEAALGLIERGHRLVSDDIVKVKKREGNYLEGTGAELTRHHLEVRGIGIINVAHLHGAVCVRDSKRIDLVVKLEVWDEHTFYDRVGLEEKTCDILDLMVPLHLLPVKPGRDVVLLLETIALNHRLKGMGYNSAKEFNSKLLQMIAVNGAKGS